MKRHFNTTGPVIPEQHYCIDPMTRLDWEDVQHLIGTGKFFVLHAPRQTGKTSTLLSMMDVLNQSDEYQCLYIKVESAQSARGDVAAGMRTIVNSLVEGAAIRLKETRLREWRKAIWDNSGAHGAFNALLSRWAQESDKPIVLMIDEVDALVGDTLGQPWLVNALGHELTWKDKSARDRSTPITLEHYRAARERLIYSRSTHLSQLSDKLKEPRVHGVISALLSGEASPDTLAMDDVEYVVDLGLIVSRPQLRIANRIYQEVIPRELWQGRSMGVWGM